MDLCIVNTWFPKRKSHLVTYCSGDNKSQIDYWCIRKCSLKLVHKQSWFWNDTVQSAVQAKRKAFITWKKSKSQVDRKAYLDAKKAAMSIVGKAKKDHYNDLYDALDSTEGANLVYQLARSRCLATADIKEVRYVKDQKGELLFDPLEVCNRWREHFSLVANEEFPHPPIPFGSPVAGPVPAISEDEVRLALRSAKGGKACGPDDIPTLAWQLSGEAGVSALTALFNSVVEKRMVPAGWLRSTTVPVFKRKGDVFSCSSYRPIRLLAHTVKVLERIIDKRIREVATISVNQCGFRNSVGTTDAIFAIRQLMERHREWNLPVYSAFLDLEKAFDRVPHEAIWWALREHLVPEEYITWVQCLYHNATTSVRCPLGSSVPFEVKVGVHQGSALSPLLFILVMDSATRDLHRPPPWTLLYADDVALSDTSIESLEKLTQEWGSRLQQFGLKLNVEKSEFLATNPPVTLAADVSVAVGGVSLVRSSNFKYLGSILSSDGCSKADVGARVSLSWNKWRSVTGVLCDKRMPMKLKSKVYRTMVRPVALYGAECRSSTELLANRLHCMEMNMLRWSLGVTRLDRIPNDIVRMVYGVRPIKDKIVESRLRWFGHVCRSAPDSIIGSAWTLEVGGWRGQGRPKIRWYKDNVRKDMVKIGATEEDAMDRVKWRRMIKAADPPAFGRINA
ncbi:hypothetical protein TYRP_002727 [Tyrophagus putrescentiae]|nr:hypothetical protein TYRP_002727 [Tyrophagus putrescentiae]